MRSRESDVTHGQFKACGLGRGLKRDVTVKAGPLQRLQSTDSAVGGATVRNPHAKRKNCIKALTEVNISQRCLIEVQISTLNFGFVSSIEIGERHGFIT